jgi:hypothetical protein
LLAYLHSQPKRLTMESFICLTDLLRKAGWRYESDHWQKDGFQLLTQAAAQAELERQIAADRHRILKTTVVGYQGNVA